MSIYSSGAAGRLENIEGSETGFINKVTAVKIFISHCRRFNPQFSYDWLFNAGYLEYINISVSEWELLVTLIIIVNNIRTDIMNPDEFIKTHTRFCFAVFLEMLYQYRNLEELITLHERNKVDKDKYGTDDASQRAKYTKTA